MTLDQVTVSVLIDGQLVRWLRGGGGGPPTVPDVPTAVAGSADSSATASLSWGPPASDGGSPITGYVVTRDGTNPYTKTVAATVFLQRFLSLTASTTYHLTVAAINAEGTGPAVTVTVTTPTAGGPPPSGERFPGDSNPRVTGKMFWGTSGTNGGPVTAHETATGVQVALHRKYWSAADSLAAINPPGGGLLQTVRDDHTNNRLPYVSFKPPSWATAGAGGYDTQFDALIAELESYAKPTWLVLHHEPENDNQTSAAWRAMQSRFRLRLNAYRAAHPTAPHRIAFMSCLMAYTWNAQSGRNPEDWYVAGAHDAITVDHYTRPGEAIERPGQWGTWITWIVEKGLPWGVGEWGLWQTDTEAAQKMLGFYNDLLDGAHDCCGIAYWNTDKFVMSDVNGLLSQFRALMKDPRSLHLSDLGY